MPVLKEINNKIINKLKILFKFFPILVWRKNWQEKLFFCREAPFQLSENFFNKDEEKIAKKREKTKIACGAILVFFQSQSYRINLFRNNCIFSLIILLTSTYKSSWILVYNIDCNNAQKNCLRRNLSISWQIYL